MPIRRGKVIVEADVTDWADEAKREELCLDDEQDVVAAALDGHTTSKIARMAVAGREIGMTESHWLPLTKLVVASGATLAVNQVLARQKRPAKRGKGNVREIVMRVSDGDGGGKCEAIAIDDDRSADEALAYLLRVVPGYIRGRLAIIDEAGGDVRGAAAQLIGIIEEMVEELS